MTELKPCPFCGRTPTVDDCGEHRYFVRCKCGIAQDKLYAQKCDAVRRWNTRKTEKRDIPVKPVETTDKAWGIPSRQAVCPNCNYYLGHIAFLGDYKGKRITYCETCGQAIDWEGWELDE